MNKTKYLGWFIFLSATNAFTQTTSATQCSADEILIPIVYQFKDADAQYAWVYRSVRPSLTLGMYHNKIDPQSMNVADGTLNMAFCIRAPGSAKRLTLRIGPRVHDLAVRPITKGRSGVREMSPILLVGQPRPDWVVMKSFERLLPELATLPTFDLEIFNFGPEHPGGGVQFDSFDHGRSCHSPSPGRRVVVQVSISGQRLRIATSDPDYPEELISRQARLDTGTCGSNFDFRADFGPTGQLPPGLTRIRYTLREILPKEPGSNESSATNIWSKLFAEPAHLLSIESQFLALASVYSFTVVGEGIW